MGLAATNYSHNCVRFTVVAVAALVVFCAHHTSFAKLGYVATVGVGWWAAAGWIA
jgi:uncharacterized membrane protein